MKTFTIDGNTFSVGQNLNKLINKVRATTDDQQDLREELYQAMRDEVLEIVSMYEDIAEDKDFMEVVQDWTYDEMLDMVWDEEDVWS